MIYLIESTQYYKIGFTKNINKRMKSYSTHNPDYILIDSMDGTKNEELFLHNLCKNFHYKLEWYHKNDTILHIWNYYKNKIYDNTRTDTTHL